MNQLTAAQKARIFAMYIGCRISTPGRSFHPNRNSQNEQGQAILTPSILADCHEGTFSYNDFKLHLRPASKIAYGDAVNLAKITFPALKPNAENGRWAADLGGGVIGVQFLASCGYAFPLFIGPDHPDNGKTAIELGMAIDSTQ